MSAALAGLLALAVRVAVIVATPGYRPRHDDASYVRVAHSLLALGRYPGHHLPGGGWQQSAYRPPGWPVALAAVWHLVGVDDLLAARALAAVLGAAAVVLTATLAGRLFGPRAAVATGVLAALSPLAVAVDASLESEALFTCLVVASACTALAARSSGRRWAAAGAGLLAGLAALTRLNGLVLVPIVAALALPPTLPWRRRVVHIVVPVVVAALLIAPWTLRNATQLHAFVPVSTETGNTLAGVYNHASLRHGARWLLPAHTGAYRAIYRRYGAGAKADGALTGAVVRWVARHPAYPARVLVDNSARLLGLTGPAWAAFSLRTMSLGRAGAALVWAGVLAVTLLALAGARAARGRGAPRTVWLMLAALFVPVALVNGELRLGAPAQALLLPLAGLAVATAVERAGGLLRRGRSGALQMGDGA